MNRRHRYREFTLVLLLACFWAAGATNSAQADQIEFNNGDRLTGRIVAMDSGKITLETDVAGKIEIPLEKVRTFSTTEPIAVHLSDGTVIDEPFEAAGDGEVRSASTSRQISFDSVDTINPPESAWHGAFKAGTRFERGNSFKNEANIRFDAVRQYEVIKLSLYTEYDGERNRDQTTHVGSTSDREITAGIRSDRAINERWSWFTQGEYEKDGVEDLDLRLKASSGPTYHWWKTPKFGFSTDLGLSWVSARYDDSSTDEDYAGLKTGWHLNWNFADNASFFHYGTWEPSLEDFSDVQLLETTTGIKTDLTSSLFFEARVDWDWNSEPSAGSKSEDVDYILSLGYKF